MKECLLCERDAETDSWRLFFGGSPPLLCLNCLESLERIKGPVCKSCSRPMKESAVCVECKAWESSLFAGNLSFYHYNKAMQSLITRFKYRGDYILAAVFAKDIQKAAAESACDLLCAVPLPPSRLAERRFNQSEALIEAAGLEHVPLIARRESNKQAKKSRSERIEAEQTFYPVGDAAGKSVLVIDDVYTTGATMRLVAKALEEAGALCVKSITIARSGS